MSTWRLLIGDVRARLADLPDASVQCVVTSPPFYGLRDYGTAEWEGGDAACEHRVGGQVSDTKSDGAIVAGVRPGVDASRCLDCGAVRKDQQIGLEATPDEYVTNMVGVFREVRRVLRDDGTCWVNLGDSYAGSWGAQSREHAGKHAPNVSAISANQVKAAARRQNGTGSIPPGSVLKPKDLMGIPWRVVLALQADGWWLRSDIIWCLSGGTKVYARTQKGEMPTTIKDLVRLDPSTVQLWNGERWTQVLGWNESERGDPMEIELRSGERIGCTEGHLWPTHRGNVRADELEVGDVIHSTTLPEPVNPYRPRYIGPVVAWLLGLYMAEGSMDSRGRLQFSGHADQTTDRIERMRPTVEAFGGTINGYVYGNTGNITVDCPALTAIVKQYIHGKTAKTKGIKARAWRHDNEWLGALLRGYLHGDGHWDEGNKRWRLGFTRNDRLADDIRTLAARLGYTLTLKATTGSGFGETWPTYRGEIRDERSGHHNERPRSEVVAIRRSRARKFWDIGVADAPHTFALASGVLTNNSKPNPMPESVTDRPTKAHEYVFLLTKSERYFYDADAIREPHADVSIARARRNRFGGKYQGTDPSEHSRLKAGENYGPEGDPDKVCHPGGRNARSVWTIAAKPYPGAHFATFPPQLAEKCILAGTSQHGACGECGAPWERVIVDTYARDGGERTQAGGRTVKQPVGWQPTCDCGTDVVEPCVVLDPFAGSGTTGMVATGHGRRAILIELNSDYAPLIRERCGPMLEEAVAP